MTLDTLSFSYPVIIEFQICLDLEKRLAALILFMFQAGVVILDSYEAELMMRSNCLVMEIILKIMAFCNDRKYRVPVETINLWRIENHLKWLIYF